MATAKNRIVDQTILFGINDLDDNENVYARIDGSSDGILQFSYNTDSKLILRGIAEGVNADDAVTKAQLDGYVEGLDIKDSVYVATQGVLPSSPTYDNGSSGVGATLTAGTNGAISVDSTVLTANQRVLVKNQSPTFQNGIYYVSQVGDGSNPYILTRTRDMDEADEVLGATVYVEHGTDANNRFHCTSASTFSAVGTDAVTWTLYGGAASVGANSVGLDEFEHLTRGSILAYNGDGGGGNGNPTALTGLANQVVYSDGTNVAFGKVTNAMIDDSAAIALSKLATGTANTLAYFQGGNGALASLSGQNNAIIATDGSGNVSNLTSGAQPGVVVFNGSNAPAVINSGALYGALIFGATGVPAAATSGYQAGYVLTANDSAAPTWQAVSGGTPADNSITLAKLADASGPGALVYGAGGAPSAATASYENTGYVLTSTGTGAPTWQAVSAGTPSDNSIGLNQIQHITDARGKLLTWGESDTPTLLDGGAANRVCYSDGTDLAFGAVTSAMIENGTIVSADLSASAGITLSQLETGANAQIIVCNGSSVPAYVSVGGDLSVSNTGAFTINDSAITGPELNTTVYKTGLTGFGVSGTGLRMAYSSGTDTEFYDSGNSKRLAITDTEIQMYRTDGTTEGWSMTDTGVDVTGDMNISGDLDVTGGVTGASWNGSESFWKDQKAVIPDALDKIMLLNGLTWVYNAKSAWEGQKAGGVLADDLVKVLPDAVQFSEKHGGRLVNYQYIHALSIESIKKLKSDGDARDARIAVLEAANSAKDRRIAELEARIEALENEWGSNSDMFAMITQRLDQLESA